MNRHGRHVGPALAGDVDLVEAPGEELTVHFTAAGVTAGHKAVAGPDVIDRGDQACRRGGSARAVSAIAGPIRSCHGAARKASTTGASSAASVARPRWPPR